MMDSYAASDSAAAANGTLAPAEGTSISPYGTRRSVEYPCTCLSSGRRDDIAERVLHCVCSLQSQSPFQTCDECCQAQVSDNALVPCFMCQPAKSLRRLWWVPRKEQRVAEAAAKAAAAAARAKEAAALAAAAGAPEATPGSTAAPAPAQAGSPPAQPEQDPVRLKPKASQRQRPTAQPPAKQPGVIPSYLARQKIGHENPAVSVVCCGNVF